MIVKLIGPEGIKCIVEKKGLIQKLREENYSDGGQGFVANAQSCVIIVKFKD